MARTRRILGNGIDEFDAARQVFIRHFRVCYVLNVTEASQMDMRTDDT
jgi:hypothetical protein